MDPTLDEIRRRTGDPDFVLIDVLPRESYLEGHIPGARSLPVADVSARAAEVLPDRSADVVAYCGGPT